MPTRREALRLLCLALSVPLSSFAKSFPMSSDSILTLPPPPGRCPRRLRHRSQSIRRSSPAQGQRPVPAGDEHPRRLLESEIRSGSRRALVRRADRERTRHLEYGVSPRGQPRRRLARYIRRYSQRLSLPARNSAKRYSLDASKVVVMGHSAGATTRSLPRRPRGVTNKR